MFTVFTVTVVVLSCYKLLEKMNVQQIFMNLAKSIALRLTQIAHVVVTFLLLLQKVFALSNSNGQKIR